MFVVERHDHVQVSLPDWVTAAHVRELEQEPPAVLASREFWATWSPTSDMVVLGPAVHAFTDREPDVASSTDDVVLLTVEDLATLQDDVTDDEWEESGFDHADGPVHAVVEGDRVVAAAHLSAFLGGAGDVQRARGTGSARPRPRSRGGLRGDPLRRTDARTGALARTGRQRAVAGAQRRPRVRRLLSAAGGASRGGLSP